MSAYDGRLAYAMKMGERERLGLCANCGGARWWRALEVVVQTYDPVTQKFRDQPRPILGPLRCARCHPPACAPGRIEYVRPQVALEGARRILLTPGKSPE